MAEVLAYESLRLVQDSVDITSFVWASADVKDRVVFLYRESVDLKFPDLTVGGIH